MDPHEIGSGLYEAFAEACDARLSRLGALLGRVAAGETDAAEALEVISRELHDHIGDANLLLLKRVSVTAVELDALVDNWRAALAASAEPQTLTREELELALRSELFRSWIERLVKISKRYALSRSDAGQVRDLQALRLEIGRGFSHTRTGLAKIETDPGKGLVQKRVLLLDDSLIACELLSEALEELGHVVTATTRASEFWELLDQSEPQAIFIDVNLPDERGDDVCRRVRAREAFADVPIVILSSLSDGELEALASSIGANAFVSKQHGLESLRQCVEKLVDDGVF